MAAQMSGGCKFPKTTAPPPAPIALSNEKRTHFKNGWPLVSIKIIIIKKPATDKKKKKNNNKNKKKKKKKKNNNSNSNNHFLN